MPPLCNNCQSIFDHWNSRNHWKERRPDHLHHTIPGLQDSARGGCHVCILLLRGIEEHTLREIWSKWPDEEAVVEVREWIGEEGYFAIDLIWRSSPDHRAAGNVALVRAHEMDVSDNVGNIARSTDSEESWTLVNNWLHECQSNHASCSIHYLERKLPTRLVAVGSTDADLRLTLTANLPGDTPYLTLSHCWGGLEFKMLLSDNLRSLLQHIPADEFLTKTFHDAITITRRLGFKYIWIDSLCIIQNDNNDWEREAALMGNVYGGSSLNLAAVDAPTGDVGYFFHRYSTDVEACKIQISNFESRSARETWNCVPKRFWPNLTLDTVLGCRGWVFQETVLAPRTLYLGSHQLAWECRKTEACETFPIQINTGYISQAATIEAWSQTNLLDAWDTIISDYSRRALTFPKDKFVALSGVSRLFATKFDASFVAGLWRKDDSDLER